jgi:hypothetical protein
MNKEAIAVLGSFATLEGVLKVVPELRKKGLSQIKVYSPVTSPELEEIMEKKPSLVRNFALGGSILGALGGFSLASFTSLQWSLVTGGKPIISIPPFLIISFECAVLMGTLSSLVGLFLLARLPKISLEKTYDPKFTGKDFGVLVYCEERQIATAEKILTSYGAEEVRIVR